MPATGKKRGKYLFIAMMVLLVLVGISACRGFFGQAPIPVLTINKPANDNEAPVTVNFDISGSTDPDGTIVSYDLNYGDGSTHATGTAIPTTAIAHTYKTGGTYTVTLKVTDNDGRIGVATVNVTIGPLLTVFASNRGGTYGIWKMLTDGTSPSAVLDNSGQDELFPDLVKGTRDKVAYAFEDGTSWNLRTMALSSGSLIANLTTQTSSNEIQPSWSSNASKIAYASNAAQTPSNTTWKIYTMVPTGAVNSGTVLVTQTPSWAPAYSPTDANTLLFVSSYGNSGGGTSIWKWDGTSATRLFPASATTDGKHYGDASPAITLHAGAAPLGLPAGAGISKPAWSPDGTKIAFSMDDTGGTINIYVINANGAGAQTLEAYVNSLLVAAGGSAVTVGTITSNADEFCPHWLEDGSGMVFARETSAGVFNVYKVSFATGVVTNLTGSTSTDNDNLSPAAKR